MNPLFTTTNTMGNLARDIADPNVDLIPGIGFNEASRQAPKSGVGTNSAPANKQYWLAPDGTRMVEDASRKA